MAKPLVSDELWQRIEPLLPQPKPRRFRFPGRKPLDYREVVHELTGGGGLGERPERGIRDARGDPRWHPGHG
jgi:hypothetical protein